MQKGLNGRKMTMLFHIVSLLIWLLAVPFGIGLIPLRWINGKERSIGVSIIAGYIFMLAVFELVAVPIIVTTTYNSFTYLTVAFTVLILLLVTWGVVGSVRDYRQGRWKSFLHKGEWRILSLEEKIGWILFAGLLLFQLYMAFTRASFDGDDAYYVVHSLITQQSDTMYIIQPSTGRSTSLDIRHALAVFPMWAAYLGRMSKIHATIISHSVLPLALLPLSYLLYYQIGKRLLQNKKDSLPMFMILMALLQMFGNISIYTNETFLMTRTWQGKSFAGNFVMPAVIWLFLCIADEEPAKDGALQKGRNKDGNKGRYAKQSGYWLLLVLVNTCAGLSSSLAVFLCAMLTGILGFLLALRERRFSILVKAGLSCIPSAVYILLYLFLHV